MSPLKPDANHAYWPLLLTEALYLLPEDIKTPEAKTPEAKAPAVASALAEAATNTQKAADGQTIKAQASPQPDLLWGSLNKGVLLLVDYPAQPLMERQDGLFLVDVLKAIGYDFKEVATLNICRCQTDADWEYVRQLPTSVIISFGVQHAELPHTQNLKLYEPLRVEEKTILPAESLSQIRIDVERKKKLWNLLRQTLV